jgi:hypothetical protein
MKVYLLSALGYSVYDLASPAEVHTAEYISPELLLTLSTLQNTPLIHIRHSETSGPHFLLNGVILVLAISLDSAFSPVSWE